MAKNAATKPSPRAVGSNGSGAAAGLSHPKGAAATAEKPDDGSRTDEPSPASSSATTAGGPDGGMSPANDDGASPETRTSTPVNNKKSDEHPDGPGQVKEEEGGGGGDAAGPSKENGTSEVGGGASPAKKKKRATATGVSYVQMVHEAIVALRDVRGSSRVAISKYILATYPVTEGPYLSTRLSQAFKTGEQNGRFLKVRGSYKISSQFKAAEKKKKAAIKKAAEKKRRLAAAAAATSASAAASASSAAAAPSSSAAKAKPVVTLEETRRQNAEKLAELAASGSASAEELARARKNARRREETLRKREEEERRAKERADILKRRRFPMEDTKLHTEDAILGIKPSRPARPALPPFWQLACPDGRKLSPAHQSASRVDNLESGSHGLVPDLLQVYHFWRGDVHYLADRDDVQLVPEFTLQHLVFATSDVLQGHAKRELLLPPLITHLFCASLSVLLNLNLEGSEVSPILKGLFRDLRKCLYPVLTPASWADVCSLYMDAMQRYYSTQASLDGSVLQAFNTDMSYLLGRTDTPVVPMTPGLAKELKRGAAATATAAGPPLSSPAPVTVAGTPTPGSIDRPSLYSEYLGSPQCALNRAYFKLLKSDPWMLSAEELMALLRALTDDILAFSPEASENIAKREEEMQVLLRNKRISDMNFRKARLAFEGPKKPASKKVDDSKLEKNGASKDDIPKEDEEFKPTISRKQFETAKKGQQKASDAYEKGIRKLVARTQPVGYDRNHNAIYCFRHDPEVLYVEEFRPASASTGPTPDEFQFPRSSWHVIQKTSIFDAFVGSLDTRGRRENELSEELLGPSGAYQSLRRYLEDDVKEKAEAGARRKEKEALKKKLEIAKQKCDEDQGRRSGRLAGQAEEELCQVEEEILAMERIGEDKTSATEINYDALTGRELMRKFDSVAGVETRRIREKKDSSKTRTSFQSSNLVCSGNIDGTGAIGMLVADVLELEEACQSLIPWEGFDRSGWIGKLENAVVAWNSMTTSSGTNLVSLDKDTKLKRDSIDSSASNAKRRKIEGSGTVTPGSISLHFILSSLKPPILELAARLAEITNADVARRDQEIADDNMSVDDASDDAIKKERLEKQWKKLVYRISKTETKRHVQIREMLVEALAAARKAHLPQIVAELRLALLQYRPSAAWDCKLAATKVLEANGGYEVEDDDSDSEGEEEDEEQVTDKDADVPSLVATDALVIAASLGESSDEATRKDWIGAVKSCKTVARLASLTKGFVQAAQQKLSKLREEEGDLSEALARWEKDMERRMNKKVGRPTKLLEVSEVWTNADISNEICMAKTEKYPWWPAKKCVPKDPAISEKLARVDRCLVSLFGEMGSLRIVKNDQTRPFEGEAIQDDDYASAKRDMRNQLDEFIAMGRRLQRGLLKKSGSRKGV